MEYYNHRGELVTYNEEKCLDSFESRTAELFFYEDFILKRYHGNTDDANRIIYEVFEKLNSIDNRHLLKINELLNRKDRYRSTITMEDFFKRFRIDAYTMPIIKEDKINLLEVNVEYIYEMLEELQALFAIISSLNIEIDDLDSSNVFLQENNIIIFDWDNYRISKKDKDSLLKLNYSWLTILFSLLFYYTYYQNKIKYDYIKIARGLFENLSVESAIYENKSLAYQLKNTLKGCKTVNEYLHKK